MGGTVKIYHGHPSPDVIEKCREAAPSYKHGAEWSHQKMTPHDWPYILDNGAFHAYKHNKPWDATAFVRRLNQLGSMPREPDFVVLPDVVTNPELTKKRSKEWAKIIDHPTAFPCQDGIKPDEATEFAQRIGARVLFIGGTREWKRENSEALAEAAHDSGLKCHIGRPGNLVWARDVGADSVDLTSIARDGSYHRLEYLENNGTQQQFLFASTDGGTTALSTTDSEQ